ncbi:hypothetical protein GCM10009347_04990 [Shewanella algicola]|uniref:DUF2897 family protein n=1 Tax=Shewanella algicola TaxID=640633 RepID=A0A9X1Z2B7_9GAMM|nr:DUF2897 family protein [Shewanella algicola]MCL1104086.1 DUF2897 family protein [Shewanella algicola]GGP40206.1 hypothetical protein GCM10009347_04990 [Shewanella algicola]
MSLEGYEVWLIIILVLGVIASNIAVLKYSAKFKMPQFGDPKEGKSSEKPKDEAQDDSTSPVDLDDSTSDNNTDITDSKSKSE